MTYTPEFLRRQGWENASRQQEQAVIDFLVALGFNHLKVIDHLGGVEVLYDPDVAGHGTIDNVLAYRFHYDRRPRKVHKKLVRQTIHESRTDDPDESDRDYLIEFRIKAPHHIVYRSANWTGLKSFLVVDRGYPDGEDDCFETEIQILRDGAVLDALYPKLMGY